MKALQSILFITGILFVVFACTGVKPKSADPSDEENAIPVKVMSIDMKTIPQTVEYTANLTAYEELHFAPASPGRIESIEVEVGNRVSKGQVLVQMDKTQLQQALFQYQNAQTEFFRIDTLHKLGSISEQQYEQVKTQYDVASNNLDYLKENTTLVSPLNGIVTGKYYEEGELYSGSPNTQAGKAAIISLMQINPLKALIYVSERYFPLVKEGMKASVITDIYPGQVFNGQVNLVYPTIDPNTRSFQVEIKIANPKEVLRPGMFARVNLDLGELEAFVVPAIALIQEEGTNNRYIFLNENGTAKKVKVTVGRRFDDQLEILSEDVQAGMQLIIAGQANLLDSSKIYIVR